MPTELEELVGFLHHGNTQIRQIAVENLLIYSQSYHSVFKINQLEPIKDLKLLVKDYNPIAQNVLTILINLADDKEVLHSLATDDAFLETVLLRITDEKEPNADQFAMLLANMAKADEMLRILELQRGVPETLSTSPFAIDQLMDSFVKGAEGSYNKSADYDYLSYFFADLSKFPACRTYFTSPQPRDNDIIPLTKLIVFTEHKSAIRRRGVASTIKNVAFQIDAHLHLLASDEINILPYVLLPLMGPEEYGDEDTEGMLEDLQLLPPDKARDTETDIMETHLETLLLLTTTREGRDILRRVKVYPVVRETHMQVEDEGVREACDRVVQVIMRDEEGEAKDVEEERITEIVDDDDDDEKIIDVV